MVVDKEAAANAAARDGCIRALALIIGLNVNECPPAVASSIAGASVACRGAFTSQSPVKVVIGVLCPITEARSEVTNRELAHIGRRKRGRRCACRDPTWSAGQRHTKGRTQAGSRALCGFRPISQTNKGLPSARPTYGALGFCKLRGGCFRVAMVVRSKQFWPASNRN